MTAIPAAGCEDDTFFLTFRAYEHTFTSFETEGPATPQEPDLR